MVDLCVVTYIMQVGVALCVGVLCYTEKATWPGIAWNDNTMHVPTARSSADLTKPKQEYCVLSTWVCCDGIWFAFVMSTLRLAVVLPWIDFCYASCVLLGYF